MATVYLARVSGAGGFQRFVAIKRLHPHLAREEEFIEMFLDEARLAARIHHPNVVSILEIGTSEQGYYIVMEYVEGDTLAHLLTHCTKRGQRLPMNVALRIIIDVLAGLDAAHELKDDDGKSLEIVHRDVSPQNVLVGVDGSARLSDFGVARAATRLTITRTGQVKGKVAYMAPEQARGEKDIDGRADVFAAGIVLWEVLTCRRLFKGEGDAHTLNKVLSEAIPSLESFLPDVPKTLQPIVDKALERDRNVRYATAAEFADALETAARQAGVLGTNKEVAAYLEAMLGPEISEQREAVRAWVVRSEPGRRSWSQPPPAVRPSEPLVTRIDRKEATPSNVPSLAGLGSLPSVPNLLTPPRSGGVSSAASPVAMRAPESSPDATQPRAASRATRSAPVWPWLLLVLAAVAAGLAFMVRARSNGSVSSPAAAMTSTPSPSVTAIALPVEARTVAPTVVVPAAVPAPAESIAASPRTAPRIPRGPEPTVAPPALSSGGAPAPKGPAADDISRNPYR
jgi:eukaryotic-like serine/threonine-protein kinase